MIPKGQNGYIESKNKNYIYRIGLCKQELLGAVNKKYEEEKNYQKRNETVVVGGEIDIPYGYEVKYSRYFRHVGLRKITDRGLK